MQNINQPALLNHLLMIELVTAATVNFDERANHVLGNPVVEVAEHPFMVNRGPPFHVLTCNALDRCLRFPRVKPDNLSFANLLQRQSHRQETSARPDADFDNQVRAQGQDTGSQGLRLFERAPAVPVNGKLGFNLCKEWFHLRDALSGSSMRLWCQVDMPA